MKKMGHLSSFLPGLNYRKKCIFRNNFVLASARNLSLLKLLTYMYLKVLVTLFQKMIWHIGV